MNNIRHKIPAPGERCAYPQTGVAKRAALLFDRIYVSPWDDSHTNTPSSIKFDVPKVDEYMNTLWNKLRQQFVLNNPKSEFTPEDISNRV
jgi:hypothetical protein